MPEKAKKDAYNDQIILYSSRFKESVDINVFVTKFSHS